MLARPLRLTERPRAEGWVAAIDALLTNRYGNRITESLRPLFLGYVADAVNRRLAKPIAGVEGEAAGPSNVRWAASTTRGGWFLPEELEQMDQVTGGGGARTVRTPAPDGIRLSNLVGGVVED